MRIPQLASEQPKPQVALRRNLLLSLIWWVIYFSTSSCSPRNTAIEHGLGGATGNKGRNRVRDREMIVEIADGVRAEPAAVVSLDTYPIASTARTIHKSPVIEPVMNREDIRNRGKLRLSPDTIDKNPTDNPKRNSLAVVGFVLSMLSFVPMFGIIAAVPAIVLSVLGLRSEKRKLAKAGLLLGILGLALGIGWWILYFSSWA
jgi:hypothetical protein